MNDRMSMTADELYQISTRLIGDLTLQRDHLQAQYRALLPRDMPPNATTCELCAGSGWLHAREPLGPIEGIAAEVP